MNKKINLKCSLLIELLDLIMHMIIISIVRILLVNNAISELMILEGIIGVFCEN